jgi:tetratricopeptide (TPR) repeat protein
MSPVHRRRPTPPPAPPPRPTPVVQRRTAIGLAVAIAVLAGAVGAWSWWRSDRAVARVVAALRPLAGEVPADQVERRAAIEVADRLLRDFPMAPEALYARGRILLRHGFQEEAERSLQAALALVPDLAPAHELLGLDALQRGHAEEAAVHLRRALDSDPTLPAAGVALGEALNNLGRMPEAITVLERVVAAKPSVAAAHFQLGQAWSYLGEPARAKAAHLAALRCDPANGAACFGVAQACERLGEHDMAEEYRRRHVDLIAADRHMGQRRVREGQSADEARAALVAAYDLAARIYAGHDRTAEAAELRALASAPPRGPAPPPAPSGSGP